MKDAATIVEFRKIAIEKQGSVTVDARRDGKNLNV